MLEKIGVKREESDNDLSSIEAESFESRKD
jgi:hypothetical protein